MPLKLILASSSPYRRELLERLKIPFEVMAPEVDETPRPGETPEKLVERLAIEKARKITGQKAGTLVIGSDQVAVYNGSIVGKPHNHDKAVEQLRSASGKTVTLYTGLALVNADTGRVQHEVIPYRVTFRALTDAQIESYLRKEQPYSCAGSVKSEGLGIALLEKFEGDDPNTLIGLPLIRLVRMLENEGIKII
ncbi:MAG: septum formation protein Maf [Candidatus Muproteobacteria bacterium RIFCSPHIGHO2_12_FULL_60_33]|uniref:7-methyl-GTP pyrophosphatase n=1 Tax=Candidatus Muproteobacteria bacterium RIFCSPLOWO2_01_FULL_60_18 TaxID=1817768 RepID=A0A1F6TYN8_9PROT|nr:MAG: septum formation protein Maf [Candidatus Muproteobacteria bacterium RIFCSPLOWO2_01_FULL_60_18]OGI53705.1 MAG: septum formation protein Maf [Candidatus Muproteobacteria bacterium RIFCSPHIGHO2_01_60_12]OGI53742.1 MAG: septum formation protein Maf [Candidatus Muproteobacteria bacterium RIFCSPHIGHO2_02_FULL_60_13]OGI56039.1 MAG: septum formation protein Maf [Candidatus Muproteobacteria bacterium RIFCSPHIGHO2_12_FULL_60_33]OGI58622.1 MAG: septum formation protein Maf [Candidatus Muproteobact